jgi:hypothetical protein
VRLYVNVWEGKRVGWGEGRKGEGREKDREGKGRERLGPPIENPGYAYEAY